MKPDKDAAAEIEDIDADDGGASSDDLFARLKDWFKTDWDHSSEWRRQAKEDFDFAAGEQWSKEDRTTLESQGRPVISFNRIGVILNSVLGSEINNRQEVRYIPREIGDAKANEILTSAGNWFRDQCHADHEDSNVFYNNLVCGMGWSETRLDYAEDEAGKPIIECIDPMEMVWDAASRRPNLIDARRLFRVKDMSRGEARRMFPDADPAMLDAPWARDEDAGKPSRPELPRYVENDKEVKWSDDDRVTIVHCQWVDEEDYYFVVDPMTGQKQDLPAEVAEQYEDGESAGLIQEGKRRVVRQAFLGGELLEDASYPLCKRYSWTCQTGMWDRNQGTWYGLVRNLKDPQRWANKWLSQALHILNTNAKGGIIAETGAFEDQKQAEESWAKSDRITWAKSGKLGSGAIQPKPAPMMPAGFFDLMNFAVSSIRDVSGVNLELLGQRDDAMSSGVLEYQRRQSAMTVLARLFDAQRLYREHQGKLMLDLIVKYLSDGRLIRIVGDQGAQYVPLVRRSDVTEFDVIVDQAPSAPNEKEKSWGIISMMLPTMQDRIPPELWPDLIEYSPLPASLVDKIKEKLGQAAQQPPPKDPAVMKAEAEIQAKQMQMQADQQMAVVQMQQRAQIDQQKLMADADMKRMQAAADIEVMRERAAAELAIQRQKAAQDFELRRAEMMLEAELKREQMRMLGATDGPGDETNVGRVAT